MKSERNKNAKLNAGGTQSNNSLTEKTGSRRYKIAAAILLVFVLHFAWQFSFIQMENLRIVQDSLNDARIDISSVEIPPNDKTVEVKPEIAVKKVNDQETGKNIVRVKYAPPENERPQPEAKRKIAKDSRTERLRRAEKLLTGF